MFNSSGICFLEKQIEILFSKTEEYNNYKLKIKRIGHLFYQYQQKINEKEKEKENAPSPKNKDKLIRISK